MIHNSQITEVWTKKDYFKTIFNFFIHALIIMALFLGAVFINEGSIEKLVEFFATPKTCMNFLYSGLALLFLLAMLYLYFYYEYRDFLKKASNIFLIFLVLECAIIVSFTVGKYLNIYARPVSLCALLILLLVNRRSAIILNIAYALIMFMIDTLALGEFGYDKSIYFSMLIGVTTGLLAIYLVSNVSSRIKVFLMGFLISIPITICIVCFEFTNKPTFPLPLLYH